MDYREYNRKRFRRKMFVFRLRLGIEQMRIYPIINMIWILFVMAIKILLEGYYYLLSKIRGGSDTLFFLFKSSLMVCCYIMILLIIIGIVYGIAEIIARKDEANLVLAFPEEENKDRRSILISKKKVKHTDVVVREFYSLVPKDVWDRRKKDIEDKLDIHLVKEMTYGGKKKNNGNRIILESGKGRIPPERGDLYEDLF